jgi:hypothetical protein
MRPDPRLIALFSESPGDAFVQLLGSLGIETVWWQDDRWQAARSSTTGPGH